jgi:hypothetical protein
MKRDKLPGQEGQNGTKRDSEPWPGRDKTGHTPLGVSRFVPVGACPASCLSRQGSHHG